MITRSDREPPTVRRRRAGLALTVLAPLAAALGFVAMPFAAQSPGPVPDGFTRIFNGKDLSGWHPSRTAHHGKTPLLTVKDGAVYILQHPFGQGGVLMTDRKYGDFEFYVETDLKPGFNSGIFLRSTEEGCAYQVELDANAGNGALLGESLRISQGARPTRVAEVWKPNGWNSFRIRMVGAAPRITLWINGEQMWDVQEPKNDMIAGMTDGFIGLQFHFLTSTGPSSMVMPLSYNTPGVPLGFRNMAIREIKSGEQLPPIAQQPPATAPGGTARASGGGAQQGQPAGRAAAAPPPPPPPPGPADHTNSIGMEFMLIKPGKMIAGRYNPNPIVPPAAAPAPAVNPAGAAPPAAAGAPQDAAAAGRGAGRGGAPRLTWNDEQYALAEKLRQEALIPGFTVTIDRPYYIGRYEVTQAEWKKVMGRNPSVFQGDKVTDDADRHPVESVSWADAQAFVRKLNQMEETNAYRLPTEFEWEWASRAGSEEPLPTPGEGNNKSVMFKQGGTTAMVGTMFPNAWGLYDMLGNVWEWVQDFYNDKVMPDAKPPSRGQQHVLKGAGYLSHVANVVSTVHAGGPGDPFNTGFRIVKEAR
jgi:formylglycine-generating enzyme